MNCRQTVTEERVADLGGAMVFGIWNFRKTNSSIENGQVFVRNFVEEDMSPSAKSDEDGLSMTQRQLLQIQYVQ